MMRLDNSCHTPVSYANHWSEQDVILISYGDSILEPDQKPLVTLKNFINQYQTQVHLSDVDINHIIENIEEWKKKLL